MEIPGVFCLRSPRNQITESEKCQRKKPRQQLHIHIPGDTYIEYLSNIHNFILRSGERPFRLTESVETESPKFSWLSIRKRNTYEKT